MIKFRLRMRIGDQEWIEEYDDPKERHGSAQEYFQNMVNRMNEKSEQKYGESAQFCELVSVEQIKMD